MKGKKIYYIFITLAFVIMATFNACKPEPEPDNNTTGSVKVATSSVSNITETSAKCGGRVEATGYTVGECGLCWNTTGNPTIDDDRTTDQIGTGYFVSTISGLEKATKYYVKAYASTSSGTLYGEQKEFTTDEPTTGIINGHEWVDLGLPSGLKWATCNVGANSPENYGNYYAWGETETKSTYTESSSLTYGLSISELQLQDYIDGEGNLTPSHDAATANWGSAWRMPTKEELEELEDKCTWIRTTQNGVKGYEVNGPNGNRIFLPAAGYRLGSSLDSAGEYGRYWSSTPDESDSKYAYYLYFLSKYQLQNVSMGIRNFGMSVRPVSE